MGERKIIKSNSCTKNETDLLAAIITLNNFL